MVMIVAVRSGPEINGLAVEFLIVRMAGHDSMLTQPTLTEQNTQSHHVNVER